MKLTAGNGWEILSSDFGISFRKVADSIIRDGSVGIESREFFPYTLGRGGVRTKVRGGGGAAGRAIKLPERAIR